MSITVTLSISIALGEKNQDLRKPGKDMWAYLYDSLLNE